MEVLAERLLRLEEATALIAVDHVTVAVRSVLFVQQQFFLSGKAVAASLTVELRLLVPHGSPPDYLFNGLAGYVTQLKIASDKTLHPSRKAVQVLRVSP
jgi:hypothetical protein